MTTAGFRDVIHIGRRQRPQNYSIQQDIPWQANRLVERHLRFEIPQRIVPPHGDVLVELDEQSVRRAAAEMRRAGVTAVAVCFLFSYLNPSHERRAAEILTEELPGAFICTSSDVIPQFANSNGSTTALNAFAGPRVRNYLQDFERRLRDLGVGGPIHLMQSNGGTATPARAAAFGSGRRRDRRRAAPRTPSLRSTSAAPAPTSRLSRKKASSRAVARHLDRRLYGVDADNRRGVDRNPAVAASPISMPRAASTSARAVPVRFQVRLAMAVAAPSRR